MALPIPSQSFWWILILIANICFGQTFQCPANVSITGEDSLDATYQVFPAIRIQKPTGNPLLGKANYTYCCALALDKYLSEGCVNTADISVSGLENGSQYPCGASFNGNLSGAPVVRASYNYVDEHCKGWEISKASDYNTWLEMLIGFLLPAAIFSLNVPRRRQLAVQNRFFVRRFLSWNTVAVVLNAIVAFMIVVLDTVVWLCTVLAFAAPLLLSGLYEACLDHRVIKFIDNERNSSRLPLALRARMLFTILCGNLDLYPAWKDSMQLASSLDNLEERRDIGKIDNERDIVGQMSARLTAMLACQYGFGAMIGAPVLFYIGSFIYTLLDARQDLGNHDVSHALSFGIWWMVIPHVAVVAGLLLGGNNPNTLTGIVGTERQEYQLGEREKQVGGIRRNSTFAIFKLSNTRPQGRFPAIYRRIYDAAYQPATMYNRGASKQSWLLVLCTDTLLRYRSDEKGFEHDLKPAMEIFLTSTIIFSLTGWLCLGAVALGLVLIPCTMGLLQAWFTPQLRIACRSLTFLIYGSTQIILLVLWVIRTTLRDKYWCHGARIRRTLFEKDRRGEFWNEIEALKEIALRDTSKPFSGALRRYSKPHNSFVNDAETARAAKLVRSTGSKGRNWFKRTLKPLLAEWAYRFTMALVLSISVFSAIGGTLMQLMGVYRNNICKLSITKWIPANRADAWLDLSTNSALQISQAKGTWTILSSLGVSFLVMCCYGGWWYQTKLRQHFTLVADGLVGSDEGEDEDEDDNEA